MRILKIIFIWFFGVGMGWEPTEPPLLTPLSIFFSQPPCAPTDTYPQRPDGASSVTNLSNDLPAYFSCTFKFFFRSVCTFAQRLTTLVCREAVVCWCEEDVKFREERWRQDCCTQECGMVLTGEFTGSPLYYNLLFVTATTVSSAPSGKLDHST